MGGGMSFAQKYHVEELRQLGRKKYFSNWHKESIRPLSKTETVKLLTYVWAHCPSYPETGSLRVETWKKIGAVFHQQPRAPADILCLWRIAFNLIEAHANLDRQPLLNPPPYSGSSVVLTTPLPPDSQSAIVPTTASAPVAEQHPPGAVRRAYQEAMRAGTLGVSDLEDTHLFPVTYQPPAAGGAVQFHWEALPLNLIKDTKKAVKDYGIHSPYTTGILRSIGVTYQMLPQDWKDLARMILTGTQYVVFESEYRREAASQAARPAAQFPLAQLFGEGAYTDITAQAQALTAAAFPIINLCVMTAFNRVDESGLPVQSFSAVRQGATEPYSQFIDRLQKAVERQISNKDAAQEILMKLAFEHANADCQAILKPLQSAPNLTLADFLKACRIVGTHAFQMDALAAAIQKGNQPQGTCFNCGKSGHFKKQCRAPGGSAARPFQNTESKPKTVCSKCKKGFHWANQCRSSRSNQGNL